MIDIDEMVMKACAKHMRATCGDALGTVLFLVFCEGAKYTQNGQLVNETNPGFPSQGY